MPANDDLFARLAAESEQTTETVKQLATVVTAFYLKLVAEGMPELTATQVTVAWLVAIIGSPKPNESEDE